MSTKIKQCSECQRDADFILEDGFGQPVLLCDMHYAHDKGELCEDEDCEECESEYWKQKNQTVTKMVEVVLDKTGKLISLKVEGEMWIKKENQ